MRDYLVSIIIPVFNAENYLIQCVESVQHQTYNNLEIILIDDGSTDNSPQICDAFCEKDSRVKAFHQVNKGVSVARNVGIENASGDYFAFLDSDDELSINAVELLLEDAIKCSADMVSAVKSIIDKDGNVRNIYGDNELNVYTGLDMLKLSLKGDRQTNSACAKLFKRSFFENVRFEEGRSINEDGFYLFQCYALKPVVVQHNISIYNYFIRSNSNSRNSFSEKYLDMLYFVDRKKEIILRDFPELQEHLVTMEVSTNLFFLEILCRTTDKKYSPHAKQSIGLVRRNYKNFYCINKHERTMAWIVYHRLYYFYKLLLRIRNRIANRKQ